MRKLIAKINLANFSGIIATSKSIISMFVPIVTGRLASAIGGFTGMLMIAQLGHAELAASALVNSVIFSVVFSVYSIVVAVGVLAGYFYGANEFAKIGSVLQQGLVLSLVSSIPVMWLLWNIAPILLFFKQDPHLVRLTQDFFRGYAWCIFPMLAGGTLSQLATGISKQKLGTLYNAILVPILIGCGYCLIFGKLGVPALGMKGMGYAYSITYTLITIAFFGHFFFFKEYKRYQIFKWRKLIDFNYLTQLFNIGWPISIMFGAELLAFSASTVLVGWMGEASLAAQQITLQINMIVIMVPYSMAQATTILVSQQMGQKNYSAIRSIGYLSSVLAMLGTLPFAVMYLFAPKLLIAFFLNVKSVASLMTVKIAIILLLISVFMNLLDAVKSIVTCALRGLRDTVYPMFVNIILSCLMSLPIGYFLAFPMHLGVVGIRLGFVAGFLIGAIILLVRFYKFSDTEFLIQHKQF